MKNVIRIFSGLMVLTACSLNASQEAALNKSLAQYIDARNECYTTGLVAFTHASFVRAYKKAGDSVFQEHYDCVNNRDYFYSLRNATLRDVATKDQSIQVKYDLDGYNEEEDKASPSKIKLVAVSDNNGENWFFIPWNDYKNDTLCADFERLLK